jgi:hypothetical protein
MTRFPAQLSKRDAQRLELVLDLLVAPWNPDLSQWNALDTRLLRETKQSVIIRASYSGEWAGLASESGIRQVASLVGVSYETLFEVLLKAPTVWITVEGNTLCPSRRHVLRGEPFFATRNAWIQVDSINPLLKVRIADTSSDDETHDLIRECQRRNDSSFEMESYGRLLIEKLNIKGESQTVKN